MPEELLVIHCSPTLAGLKTASLFACTFADDREMRSCVRCWNRRLTGKGLRILPLCFENGRALIYVYQPRVCPVTCGMERPAVCSASAVIRQAVPPSAASSG